MLVHGSSAAEKSAASKTSSDFDRDFRERAKALIGNSSSIHSSSSNQSTTDRTIVEVMPLAPIKTHAGQIKHMRLGGSRSNKSSSGKTSASESLVNSNAVVGGVRISVHRKTKLPWLDGARQSVPRMTAGPMPGSFGDTIEDLASTPISGSESSSPRHHPLPPLPLPVPRDSPQSVILSEVQAGNPTQDSSTNSSAKHSPGAESPQPVLRSPKSSRTPVLVNPLRIPAKSFEVHPTDDVSDESGEAVEKKLKPKGILKRPTRHGVESGGHNVSVVPKPNAIDKLDDLMDQATRLAHSAADSGDVQEISNILEDARTVAGDAYTIGNWQQIAAAKRLAGSDHTSTYSSISSSSDGDYGLGFGELHWRSLPTQRRKSASSVPVTDSRRTTTKGWAMQRRSGDKCARKRRRTMPDVPFGGSGLLDSEETESRDSLLSHASSMGATGFALTHVRQPMGFEGPASPFEDSPTAESAAAEMPDVQFGAEPDRPPEGWGRDKFDEKDYVNTDALRGQRHIVLKDGQRWSIHHHRRQPIARNWSTRRKRLTALVACVNTALIGMIVGIYAGEVPAIQYRMTDIHHVVNLGNVALYFGMMVSSFLFWPLPLLHGRKPYTITALAVALPLNFPQALMVMDTRDPNLVRYRIGLLLPRAVIGFALGFVHINVFATLLDLFGASLQSEHPHGEVVVVDDVRRHGGGMGLWLGAWSFCFLGSLAIGFFVGALIVSGLDVTWGFYISVMLVAVVLLLNVIAPETRRSPHRRTMQEVQLANMNVERRVGRGEVKIHVTGQGPMHWWEEVSAGISLAVKMFDQVGFFLMSAYLGWVYAQVWLVIVLLGNLLSTEYRWRPEYIGLGVLSMAVGAFLAIPLSRANLFSRSRSKGPRTDSMTFQPRLTWTSHLLRRTAFMTVLPLAGMAYTLGSAGRSVNYMVPIAFAGLVGFVSNLAVAECHGIIMETFDTSDLQPGVNSRHRLQSLAVSERRRRTSYSSYPRVSAGLAVAHALGFGLAGAATGVSGALTRAVGAQKATGIVAGVLAGFTTLLVLALVRYRSTQVIPNELFGSGFGAPAGQERRGSAASWRAVIIGNPSGRHRRLSLLELGGLSRWTEIRRLNRLLNRTTTQGLQPGWR